MTRITSCGVSPRAFAVAAASAFLFSLSFMPPAAAQTAFVGNARQVSPTPPGRPGAGRGVVSAPNNAVAATNPAPALPVAKSVVKQAEEQLNGKFPAMARAGVGGQIQDAWDKSDPSQGVHVFRRCTDANCVYKVRLREFMVTTLILPKDAQIVTADLGDTAGFQVKVKSANMLAVRPASYGIDTDLNVYTKSGAVYPFYLRAESFNSVNVPDLVARIVGRETPATIKGPADGADKGSAADDKRQGKEGDAKADGKGKPVGKIAAAVKGLTNPKANPGDFVRSIPFDPSKLHGWKHYKLWGDASLKPEIVFRDNEFTYIQYGDKWNAEDLPTAYVVVDGIDELVNTRVQGTTYIVETISPLISLKDGKKFLCIQYTGEKP